MAKDVSGGVSQVSFVFFVKEIYSDCDDSRFSVGRFATHSRIAWRASVGAKVVVGVAKLGSRVKYSSSVECCSFVFSGVLQRVHACVCRLSAVAVAAVWRPG
jgi:hypothetical protein